MTPPYWRLFSSSLREGIRSKNFGLEGDELYQSRVSSPSVNLLSEVFDKSLQVNLVLSRARPLKTPLQLQHLDL